MDQAAIGEDYFQRAQVGELIASRPDAIAAFDAVADDAGIRRAADHREKPG